MNSCLTNKVASVLLAVLLLTPFSANASDDVKAAIDSWVGAFNQKDAKEIVALYADDAVFFGTTSPVLRDSPELVWDYFKGLSDLGDSTISVGGHRIQTFNDVAINTGYYSRHYTVDGKEKSDHARFTFVYHKRDGNWMIVEHHSSALPE